MQIDDVIEMINEQWTDIYYLLHYVHEDHITHQAVRLLQYIEKNKEATIGDLAKHLAVSHNTASEHIKRLIKKGLVVKRRSSVDERKVFVVLTEEGRRVLYRHTRLDKDKLKKIFKQMDPSDIELIQKAFSILSEGARKCLR
ncbi:MarR family winged helix-turn-helix transcriptional regulator [Parageobacillus thermoglucosidasius]|uniref:HTH-type transcriptional regulator SarZ n=1 Tax=Geobacillus sp. (strain Y4.1MC1) TaxID=581103 RepID=A0A7U3YII1_GEOS0|nr:MarR family transcriptional regulator [Parageobacillus thermoglucosidasius]AEH49687.1 regulatory protein MarR [Parageobacillus thermoglucosidasius C56-YS93]MED4904917.1 MarR family transcriptional regulator [Parageobacillus thermoglucosidasius]MED4913095.1 MarR family transcriptional regulator [Parageobacillus thermoglucosidasius]MED4945418.1 MarR family transcriptional regulator [Parageobacillus thermoglucosidasius]MED4981149.1 MarR family transcriptional regulator [Parageobacillus thermog